jgi:Na+-translocating ferredoxin:NAD+ oxidoreductase RnfG subunit
MVATAQGFGGLITVKLTLKDQVVTELTIETPDEIPGMGQTASEEAFTSQFIGKIGPFTYRADGIDAITGATITSTAVLDAINQAYTVPEDAEVEVIDSMPVVNLEYVGSEEADDGEKMRKAMEEAGFDVELTYWNTEGDALQFTKSDLIICGSQGFFGPVTVQMTLGEDLTIQSIKIDASEETQGLGQKVMEEAFTSQFIGKKGPFAYGEDGIDAVSGATQTCDAVLDAINGIYNLPNNN